MNRLRARAPNAWSRKNTRYGPRDDGYRYVRQYHTKMGPRWALWQCEEGRYRRVGTATSEKGYQVFLRLWPRDLVADA